MGRSALPRGLGPRLGRECWAYSTVEEKIRTAVVAFLRAEDVFWTDVGHELIVDAYPRWPWLVAQVTVRVQYVEGVVAA